MLTTCSPEIDFDGAFGLSYKTDALDEQFTLRDETDASKIPAEVTISAVEPKVKRQKKEKPSKKSVEFFVEQIVDHKVISGADLWYVKWEGYNSNRNSWEPTSSLVDNDGVINAALLTYKRKHKLI